MTVSVEILSDGRAFIGDADLVMWPDDLRAFVFNSNHWRRDFLFQGYVTEMPERALDCTADAQEGGAS